MQQPVVPAWKRLGLKLKYANEKPESIVESNPNGVGSTNQRAETTASAKEPLKSDGPPKKKRKVTSGVENHVSADSEHSVPSDGHASAMNGKSKRPKKRVSFAADAESAPESSAASAQNGNHSEDPTTSKPKRAKKKGKSGSKLHIAKTNPALEYLDQFHRAHASWKFNKNKETWLLKHMFSERDIPGTYNLALATYIHGLKGSGARDRLKAQCLELLKKGADNDRKNGSKDGEQDLRDADFLPLLIGDLEKDPDATGTASESQEDNEDYLSWIRQQSRPQLLLRSLGLDLDALHNSLSTSTLHDSPHPNGDGGLNGAKEAKARPKNRKNRTTVVEYSSSSSGSSSESESESDDDVEEANAPKAEETTSSSGSDDSDSGDESSTDSD
ncbi:hypothetical protein LTR10_022534 [Elasticomyces elasticus]|uniref:WKF domain-containing protein n=1 Tax=Exophiala sideris TaxID=1016849 RepID=A0ABR0JG59_9EURO|nr:hypothetical protein LTR10_022534 [Elasticomyces elasticus]KAK5024020.1 hypothetical protein LTR13_011038 [Exophiala sideris]KAK5025592.1 hypothetical protein LTS07_007796 [Exophiala sideris]KAK5063683.1 hypothetical protein LTR69_004389 [Exophiala sideris]KAK5176377.1 hypothetical protein LTR44_011061 [Eurotiomycetes sp. CCFEE 6388]